MVSKLLDAISSALDDDSGNGPSTTTISRPLPCYRLSSIYNDCALHNSVFPNVIFPIQASCLCYHPITNSASSTVATWVPSAYDGLLSSCNDYAQSQTLVTGISQIGNSSADFGLCLSAGDVRATPALAVASSATSTATSTTRGGATAQPANGPTTQSAPTPTASTSGASQRRVSVVEAVIVGVGVGVLVCMWTP